MVEKDKKKLNIAMICDPIGDNKSGVVISTLRFGKSLNERGHHVIFIGAKSGMVKNDDYNNGIKTYRYRSFPVPKSNGWNLAFPSVGELKKVFKEEKIDLIHMVLPMSGSIVAIKAAKSLGIKMIAHSHSQAENLFMDMPKPFKPFLFYIWNKYLVWLYSKAELLIYPSKMAYELLDKLSKKNKKSVVISNGINLEYFQKKDVGDFYERFKISNNKINLLFLGRLFPEKSVETIIKALPYIIEKNDNVHLIIVGAGYLRKKLEKLAEILEVDKYISFLGIISEEDKVSAYNSSDIFILPSLAELEGMVVLEAMACGKPIIVSDAEMSASRYFVEGNGFLFNKKDYRDLAKQALKLINSADLRKEMGEISLEKVKKYDIHKSITALENAYYSIL